MGLSDPVDALWQFRDLSSVFPSFFSLNFIGLNSLCVGCFSCARIDWGGKNKGTVWNDAHNIVPPFLLLSFQSVQQSLKRKPHRRRVCRKKKKKKKNVSERSQTRPSVQLLFDSFFFNFPSSHVRYGGCVHCPLLSFSRILFSGWHVVLAPIKAFGHKRERGTFFKSYYLLRCSRLQLVSVPESRRLSRKNRQQSERGGEKTGSLCLRVVYGTALRLLFFLSFYGVKEWREMFVIWFELGGHQSTKSVWTQVFLRRVVCLEISNIDVGWAWIMSI